MRGQAGSETAEVVSASWFGEQALDGVFRVNGRVDQWIVFRSDEEDFELAESGRALSFDGTQQITDVCCEMLPRQPLRFLLAEDPGAGKTITAGLLINE